MFYQNSAIRSYIIFVPDEISFSSLPIVLSEGSGLDKFVNYDNIPENTLSKPSMNGKIVRTKKNYVFSGTLYFHPENIALVNLRVFANKHQNKNITTKGTLYYLNIPTMTQSLFFDCVFTQIPAPPSINKDGLGDIEVKFTSKPPQTLTLGGILSFALAFI
ncbi:hypothetical protein [Francisella tularensis]|uniref:hypothetical protein n=1 Tax=Francisella tularensis TaxID=263 RepID=UPI0008F4C329|nr:hypothetical protein [Francisella tularensis]APA83226.1 hypothetical protein N894_1242 [Francisella tularensis subsp. novicida PA10-7858]